jgi:hypothetical protein
MIDLSNGSVSLKIRDIRNVYLINVKAINFNFRMKFACLKISNAFSGDEVKTNTFSCSFTVILILTSQKVRK